MKTFEKEISISTSDFNATTNKFEKVTHKKMFTFKELDEYDQEQQKLHFKLSVIFERAITDNDEKIGSERTEINLNTDQVHELTIKFINTCLITTNEQGESIHSKEQDKRELLANSKSVYNLGSWLTHNKFYPFFLEFQKD
jgi:hypothetical protein